MIKVVLRAPVLSKSGYGEHARFVYRSLRSQPEIFDVYVHPTNWGKSSWISGDTEEIRNINQDIQKLARNPQQPMDLSVQVTIPNEWEKMAPVNIGVTAGIETDHVSPEWLQKANIMDKVIVVSEHAKQGFVKASYNVQDNNGNNLGTLTCQTPVEVVGYPVKDITPVDLSEKLNLSTDFNFLTIAQWGPRKNLENTVKWFVEEFRDEEVGLVIKTHRTNMSLGDRRNTETLLKIFLDKLGERNCKIHYLHGDMTEEELHGLYVHPKIKGFISATHGEGFGLPLFEAAYSGLPIAAPAWSGHVDFLYGNITNAVSGKTKRGPLFEKIQYDLEPVQPAAHWKTVINPDMKWCFPKEKSFKKALRSLFKSNEMKQMVAKDLKEQLLTQEDKVVIQAESIKSLLSTDAYSKVEEADLNNIPKISIITSVFNGDEFIEPFLEDITRQTIFKEKCELILINANSPGNEEQVILKYMKKYPNNIVYKKLEEDPGIYGVWNLGVKMSTGDFITNANLDDRKAPNSLELHALALYSDENVDLVYTDMAITDRPNETWENNSSNGRRYNSPPLSFETLKMVNSPHAAPMWRKSLHDKYGYFDSKYKSAGDWEMWLRASSKGSKMKKISQIVNLYFFNPNGISTNKENFGWKQEEEREIFNLYKDIQPI